MGKGYSVSDQAKMIEGGCRGEREVFTQDRSFRGGEKIGFRVDSFHPQLLTNCLAPISGSQLLSSSINLKRLLN